MPDLKDLLVKRSGLGDCLILISGSCIYCGEKADSIDRINSELGYTIENSVPCCIVCNEMKWTKSQEEFLERCIKIVRFFGKEVV